MKKISFHKNLRNALIQRQQTATPSIKWLVTLMCGSLALYVLLAILIAPEDKLEREFLEGGAITALSAILLAMASSFGGGLSSSSGNLSVRQKSFGCCLPWDLDSWHWMNCSSFTNM